MDRNDVVVLSNSLKSAIDAWAKQNGLVRDGKFNITYDEYGFKVSGLSVKVADTLEDGRRKDFQMKLDLLNAYNDNRLPKDLFGRSIKLKDGVYQVVAINTRAPKFPFVVENKSGVMKKVTIDGILLGLM